jgi:hypothetical protein
MGIAIHERNRNVGDKERDGEQTASAAKHLTIGCLVFPQQDQIDFTGPFEVLSRIPNIKSPRMPII